LLGLSEQDSRLAVVVAGLKDDEVLVDLVDEPMLIVDAPRPTASQQVAQRLGLANPATGPRSASSTSRLTRLSVARSVRCQ